MYLVYIGKNNLKFTKFFFSVDGEITPSLSAAFLQCFIKIFSIVNTCSLSEKVCQLNLISYDTLFSNLLSGCLFRVLFQYTHLKCFIIITIS